MKRIIITCLFLLIFAGCAVNLDNPVYEESTATEKSTTDEAIESTIPLITGFDFYELGWDEGYGTYTRNAVPDKETAMAVASAIFNAIPKNSVTEKYTLQSVLYDEENGIWVVSFWEPMDEGATGFTVGDDCSIAIRETNGEVLRIWYGE